MQLEKAKETKQDMERCRLLAQRIAEELAPATAAVLNAETPALEKALHRAGVDANPFTVAARQADLLVVEDPAWVEMPAHWINGSHFRDDKIQTLNAANKISWDGTGTGASQWAISSYFARVSYNYDSKYMLNL